MKIKNGTFFPILAACMLSSLIYTQEMKEPYNPPDESFIQLLSPPVNTPYYETMPFILADDSFLYFQSDRPGSVGGYGDFDIWSAARMGENVFEEPRNAGSPLNNARFQGAPSVVKTSRGELRIYFTVAGATQSAYPNKTDIFTSVQANGVWSAPEPVYPVNSDFHDRMPSISPDGKTLYFSSDRPGGYGKDDIWVSTYDETAKRWQKPVNAGAAINSHYSEISPSIHPDSISFYFASNRKDSLGGYDIYVTQKNPDNAWASARNLQEPYNSLYDDEYPTLTLDGKTMYFSSNRPGGYGKFDIYRAIVPEYAKPRVIITVKGRILEGEENGHPPAGLDKGIEANMRVDSREDNRNMASTSPGGEYQILLQNDRIYTFVITAAGYEPLTVEVDLRDEHVARILEKNFYLKKLVPTPWRDKSQELVIKLQFQDPTGASLIPIVSARSGMPEAMNPMNFLYNAKDQIFLKGFSRKDMDPMMETHSLELTAGLNGYNDFSQVFRYADIVQRKENEYPKEIVIKITLQKISGKEKEIITLIQDKKPDETIYFPYKMHQPSAAQAKKLENLVKTITEKKIPKVIIHGHTDSIGPDGYNQELSKKRAMDIKERLVKAGIPENILGPAWFGKTKIKHPGDKKEDQAKNRRVEIYLIQTEEKKQEGKHDNKRSE